MLALLAQALGAAGSLRAQGSGSTPVIGLFDSGRRLERWSAFRRQMRDLGYVEGRSISYVERFADGYFERLPELARDLVGLKAAIIVTSGNVATKAAMDATRSIPIVMTTGDDPVVLSLVSSFAHPGGNLTGLISFGAGLTAKRFEMLRELAPKLSRLAVLWHRDNPTSARALHELETASRQPKIAIQSVPINTRDEIAGAFAAIARARAGAVFIPADGLFYADRRRLAELAIEHRLPTMTTQSEYVDAGVLLSYGPDYVDLHRRAAFYVDKILRGAKPGDLPIEQPAKLELVINLNTARALGITVPAASLLRADRTVE
jgi:putative ABC transport system substrate-binding protein